MFACAHYTQAAAANDVVQGPMRQVGLRSTVFACLVIASRLVARLVCAQPGRVEARDRGGHLPFVIGMHVPLMASRLPRLASRHISVNLQTSVFPVSQIEDLHTILNQITTAYFKSLQVTMIPFLPSCHATWHRSDARRCCGCSISRCCRSDATRFRSLFRLWTRPWPPTETPSSPRQVSTPLAGYVRPALLELRTPPREMS